MLPAYKAKLQGNQIIWSEETPEALKEDAEVDVIITLLTDEVETQSPRPFGLAKGEFVVPDNFDDPLPEEILAEFEN